MAFRMEFLCLLQTFFYLLAVSEGARYLGCFNERSIRDRLFKGDFQNFTKTNSHELCWENCQSKGFNFAGVQWARQCFCSSEQPSYEWLARSEAECDMACRGNPDQKCGGHMRMGIFALAEEDSDYAGCYSEGALLGETAECEKMTSGGCKQFCEDRRYSYYGMAGRSKCICGNEIQTEQVSEEECRVPCAGDKTQLCGGSSQQVSLHKAEVREPEGPRYLGCFVERSTKDRLLQGDFQNFRETNSPEVCQAHCSGQGFTFAGVQWGHECFCSNEEPPSAFMAENQSECNRPCPGNPEEMCGAFMRMDVYRLQ